MFTTSLSLFCKVVDNFGDIGICWRLAQQLQREHGIAVSLWVDDLASFQRICRHVVLDAEVQRINHINIHYWRDQHAVFTAHDVTDIVIEFFGCEIPPSYLAAMAQRVPPPVWLNLEGLTAEKWVEGCHMLPSPHPALALTKYFFYPGFNNKTGGLLLEPGLHQQRQLFQQSPAEITAFLAQLGATSGEMDATLISLFCYPHAPILDLFSAWQNSDEPVTCLVPEGVATEAIQTFFGKTATVGMSATRNALTVRVIPFLEQSDYDKLLWACHLNVVRGEDSFVRAQWAGRPFVWHIYPQDKNLHHVKLNAFLQRFTAKTDSLVALTLRWNQASADTEMQFGSIWPLFKKDLPQLGATLANWQQQVAANGDLASNIVKFADQICREWAKK